MKAVYKSIKYLLGILLLAVFMQLFSSRTYAESPAATAALQLVNRLLPQYAGKIIFEQIITSNDSDVYELESKDGKIIISGNNANSMAVGLNHYLKYYCNISVSWWRDDK